MTTQEGIKPLITRDTAAAVIRKAFPEVDASSVRHVGSGTLYDVFLTADEWAFRFPRTDWSGGLFEQESRTHALVAEIIPSQIRLPRVELREVPTADFPYPIAGHRYIRGVAADEVEEALLPTLAREIAILLNALHSTPAPVAGAAGIRELVVDEGRRAWYDDGVAAVSKLRGLDPIVDHAITWIRANPTAPPTGALHLIHGGLESRHLLIDPDTGFLRGVIDWTDTMLGDAARDFSFLVTWKGWVFCEEVLHLYPRAVDRDFRARLRHIAQMLATIELGYAHEWGLDLTWYVRAVRNAFARTD